MRGGRRGSVLGYVLVLVVSLSYIAALIMSSRRQSSLSAANAARRTSEDLRIQSAANQVSAAWALSGGTCASNASLGVTCAGAGCDCVCRVASGAKVTASPSAGGNSCLLFVVP